MAAADSAADNAVISERMLQAANTSDIEATNGDTFMSVVALGVGCLIIQRSNTNT
jgi:hypothetical protein